jgi:hypothetical protein
MENDMLQLEDDGLPGRGKVKRRFSINKEQANKEDKEVLK